MTARQDTYELMRDLEAHGISATFEDANTLRRAQITLHRWAELECGDSNDYRSWAIERDETTGVPFMAIYPHQGESHRYRIPDREAGALRRVAEVCRGYGAHFFHQTDPRGCALYVAPADAGMTDSNYNSRGVACVAGR